MIELNDLYDYGFKIYQDKDNFKFSLDSILLAEAVEYKKNSLVMDLCCGNGSIPLILYSKGFRNIKGIEIQKDVYDVANKSILYNNLDESISIINENANNVKQFFNKESFDIVTCNPPYFKISSNSLVNESKQKAISRHELKISLDDIINNASFLLKNSGAFYMVHRSSRLQEILIGLNKYNLQAKKIYFIKTKNSNNLDLVIIKAVKGAKFDLKTFIIDVSNVKSYKNIFFER